MRSVLALAVLIVATVPVGTTLRAHHSFAAQFDAAKPITLKGKVVSMDWVNPHSWLYIELTNAQGSVEKWAIEFSSPSILFRRGWKRADLPVGLDVTVTGHLARDGTKTAAAEDIVLPDGRKLFAGSAGTDGRP